MPKVVEFHPFRLAHEVIAHFFGWFAVPITLVGLKDETKLLDLGRNLFTDVEAVGDLPTELKASNYYETPGAIEISDEGICLNSAVTEFEKALILQSLEKTKWVKNKAAKLLQLNRTTLVEKIKRHRLQPCNA